MNCHIHVNVQAFLDFHSFEFLDFWFNAVYNSILFSSPLVLKTGRARRSQFYNQNFSWLKVQKLFNFFTCILLDYVVINSLKNFEKISIFDNMTAVFLLRCQNSLRWEISLVCHWNIDSWKQKMSVGYVIDPNIDQNII